jgi:branched-chain amino acid transport system substrate-binding protein
MSSRSLRACGLVLLLLASAASPASAQDAVKIGFMAPLTGIFAPAGKDMAEGLRMAFEQAGYQAAGKKLELLEEDSEGNPAVAQTKYRKLVTQDRIHAFTGVLLANIGYALVAPIERDRLPSLFLTTPDDLTKRRPSKYVLRSNFAASQPMQALGDYAARTLRYKRVFAIAMDNPFGHEGIGGFQKVFEDSGGRIVQKVWVPLNTMDFAPFLSSIPRDVDAVVQVFVAGQAVRFAKQWGESPLHGKVPLIGTGVFSDQSALVGMGDEVIGYVGASIWAATLDNPANRTFMQMAQEKLKRTPSYFHAVMYSAGRWIIEAVKSVGGNVEDRDKLLAAIRRASETTPDPRGPIKLDEYGNPTENVYIVKVEKVGGKLQNTVVHTYPMVSQFWTYRPEEYLKMPAYDRNHPPVRN